MYEVHESRPLKHTQNPISGPSTRVLRVDHYSPRYVSNASSVCYQQTKNTTCANFLMNGRC